MANGTETPDSAAPGEDPRSKMVKTTLAPDLIAAMRSFRDADAFDVVIEFNRKYGDGSRAGQRALLAAYLKRRGVADDAVYAQLEIPVGRLPLDQVAGLQDIFAEKDELFVKNSLWTDSYAFGKLSRETLT